MLNYNKKILQKNITKKYYKKILQKNISKKYKNFYLNYLNIFTYFKYKIDFKIINNSNQVLISVNLSKIEYEKSSI
jgi:hypothetical protein